jgi:hypothetical protein
MHTEFMLGKLPAKQGLRSLRRRWKYDVKMDLIKVGSKDRRCMELFQNCVSW